jgi:hypothetical protein
MNGKLQQFPAWCRLSGTATIEITVFLLFIDLRIIEDYDKLCDWILSAYTIQAPANFRRTCAGSSESGNGFIYSEKSAGIF